MIGRLILKQVASALSRQAVVALIGPRQVGKTTLAQYIATTRPSVYLGLEAAEDRAKLANPSIWAIEVKRSLSAKLEQGFRVAFDDLKVDRAFVVYPGKDRYPKDKNIEAISLREMAQELADL